MFFIKQSSDIHDKQEKASCTKNHPLQNCKDRQSRIEMVEQFRRLYNAVGSMLDFQTIAAEINFSREIKDDAQRKTARQALAHIAPLVREFDSKAQLKMIVSQSGVDAAGCSGQWEFFYDLVRRKAKLIGVWQLVWDEQKDDFAAAQITVTIHPFPPADSPVRQMVRDGRLLYQQLGGLWKQEYKRTPVLPQTFLDTSSIVPELAEQGFDVSTAEFSLSTVQSGEGQWCWMAQTKSSTFLVPLLR